MLELSLEDFAAAYAIPLPTARAWEEGRGTPDPAASTFLALIAPDPKGMAEAVKALDLDEHARLKVLA